MDGLLQDMTSLPLLFTLTTASLLGFFYIYLSWRVIRGRHQHKVDIGAGGQPSLERDIRAHANFAEYVPLGLILLGLLELAAAPDALLWALSLALVAGRILHFTGFTKHPGASFGRVAGMTLTHGMIVVASGTGLIILFSQM